MFTLKLSIEGDFWDCQVYMGRLYLWTMDGDLQVIKWDDLVNSIDPQNSDNHLVMNCAFTNGNYLYGEDLQSIFNDREFKSLLTKKFERISDRQMVVNQQRLRKYIYGEQKNPFKELPTDTEISNKNLFGSTDAGILVSSAHRHNSRYPVSSKPQKIWDCPVLAIKANRYGQMSLSAGDEGLFEFNQSQDHLDATSLKKIEPSIFQVAEHHSQFSDWSYLSIYSSSSIDGSYMAFYEWNKEEEEDGVSQEWMRSFTAKRKFSSEIADSRIFGKKEGLSWGSGDKIYKAHEGKFSMARFRNTLFKDRDENEFFYDKHEISLDAWKGNVISGGTAYFGTIVECENALVIVMSDKKTLTIPGPITRWRIYPRSINYENHLHVILEDRIEIYSFNNDYFVEQGKKEFGLYYKPDKRRGMRRPIQF